MILQGKKRHSAPDVVPLLTHTAAMLMIHARSLMVQRRHRTRARGRDVSAKTRRTAVQTRKKSAAHILQMRLRVGQAVAEVLAMQFSCETDKGQAPQPLRKCKSYTSHSTARQGYITLCSLHRAPINAREADSERQNHNVSRREK